jgi:hypothetical protein
MIRDSSTGSTRPNSGSDGQRRGHPVWGPVVGFEAIHQAVSEAWYRGDTECGSMGGGQWVYQLSTVFDASSEL